MRGSSLKCNFAVGVLDSMRMLDFDIDAAYLQGRYTDRRVFARAPKYFRKYDERGVELVWHLQRALYGGPDSGRVWYNTFAHFLMKEDQITPFQRCHHEPCTFTHFLDGQTDANGAPKRIICSVYVDDGRTWDNCVDVCDGFYERLRQRFSITMDAGTHFMIGMDISFGDGWLKICSSTYINNMCERWLEYPIAEYDYIGTPAYPKLLDLYETAFLTRGNTSPELATRYRCTRHLSGSGVPRSGALGRRAPPAYAPGRCPGLNAARGCPGAVPGAGGHPPHVPGGGARGWAPLGVPRSGALDRRAPPACGGSSPSTEPRI